MTEQVGGGPSTTGGMLREELFDDAQPGQSPVATTKALVANHAGL